MKINYAIQSKGKFVKSTSKSLTSVSELKSLHSVIDKAYEVLCKHDEYEAVVITLRKEVK